MMVLSLYPIISILNLFLFGTQPDSLLPSLTAYVDERYLTYDILDDWLSSFGYGVAFAWTIILMSGIALKFKLSFVVNILIINIFLMALSFLIFGTYFMLYFAPLLFGNFFAAIYYVLIWRPWTKEHP